MVKEESGGLVRWMGGLYVLRGMETDDDGVWVLLMGVLGEELRTLHVDGIELADDLP